MRTLLIIIGCYLAVTEAQVLSAFGTPTPPASSRLAFDPYCKDKIDDCDVFPKTSCVAPYDAWAKANCNQTCGYCQGPTTPPPPCVDKIDNCKTYGSSVCNQTEYLPWARDNCRRFCRFCPAGVLAILDVTTTLSPIDCYDKVDCRLYGKDACSEGFKDWSYDNCPNHCGYCKPTPTTPPPCVNHVPNCMAYSKDVCTNNTGWAEDNCREFCGFCVGTGVPSIPQGTGIPVPQGTGIAPVPQGTAIAPVPQGPTAGIPSIVKGTTAGVPSLPQGTTAGVPSLPQGTGVPPIPQGHATTQSSCQDILDNCKVLPRDTCTSSRVWAEANCKATCGFCQVTTQSSCHDTLSNCAALPRSTCTLSKDWAMANCKSTCGFCNVATQAVCVDKISNCNVFPQAICVSSRDWAVINCQSTCGFCNIATTTPTPATTTTQPPCLDSLPNCNALPSSICTSSRPWAEANCKKSCGFCAAAIPHPPLPGKRAAPKKRQFHASHHHGNHVNNCWDVKTGQMIDSTECPPVAPTAQPLLQTSVSNSAAQTEHFIGDEFKPRPTPPKDWDSKPSTTTTTIGTTVTDEPTTTTELPTTVTSLPDTTTVTEGPTKTVTEGGTTIEETTTTDAPVVTPELTTTTTQSPPTDGTDTSTKGSTTAALTAKTGAPPSITTPPSTTTAVKTGAPSSTTTPVLTGAPSSTTTPTLTVKTGAPPSTTTPVLTGAPSSTTTPTLTVKTGAPPSTTTAALTAKTGAPPSDMSTSTAVPSTTPTTTLSTTTLPPTTTEKCEDLLSNCDGYPLSVCNQSSYIAWAKHNCAAYCGFCHKVTLTPIPCVDKLTNCKEYDSGNLCTAETYRQWAHSNCFAYCGFGPCGTTTASQPKPPTQPSLLGR